MRCNHDVGHTLRMGRPRANGSYQRTVRGENSVNRMAGGLLVQVVSTLENSKQSLKDAYTLSNIGHTPFT